jgi:hypothetical protein
MPRYIMLKFIIILYCALYMYMGAPYWATLHIERPSSCTRCGYIIRCIWTRHWHTENMIQCREIPCWHSSCYLTVHLTCTYMGAPYVAALHIECPSSCTRCGYIIRCIWTPLAHRVHAAMPRYTMLKFIILLFYNYCAPSKYMGAPYGTTLLIERPSSCTRCGYIIRCIWTPLAHREHAAMPWNTMLTSIMLPLAHVADISYDVYACHWLTESMLQSRDIPCWHM